MSIRESTKKMHLRSIQYRLGSNVRDASVHLELCVGSRTHDFDQILVIESESVTEIS